ncbi:hypothetical protein J4434_02845 [Candidatus Woesearchaeota archaeon]|nr:hypothetical protein [Candidatus Woesearchaeota archaeon]
MPRLEIKKGKKILAVAERPEDINLKVIKDFRLKIPQMKSVLTMKGKTIVLKGKYSEIKLFPKDIEKIKKLL